MNEENTNYSLDQTDYTDLTDRSLITDISAALKQVSSKTRKERQRQKIRAALVREHIHAQASITSSKCSRLSKFWKKLN